MELLPRTSPCELGRKPYFWIVRLIFCQPTPPPFSHSPSLIRCCQAIHYDTLVSITRKCCFKGFKEPGGAWNGHVSEFVKYRLSGLSHREAKREAIVHSRERYTASLPNPKSALPRYIASHIPTFHLIVVSLSSAMPLL